MRHASLASSTLAEEARALLTRLARVKPFALQETMVPAAAPASDTQAALERHLGTLRGELARKITGFLGWVEREPGRAASPEEIQRRFTFLRLEFQRVLSHVDIFSEALSQRSEAETGVWLSGLDVVARDALAVPGYLSPPPVICYLARGPGGAIRRARTRLPGGGDNPVAIVRLPRERMIGSGLASSLVHEVGHQGAALLDLLPVLRRSLATLRPAGSRDALAWSMWSRWSSEIVADLWAVARVGITSTLGLIGLVSLPRPFVFRTNLDDPHPMPWIRVKLSAAIGDALYPDPQWARLAALWESYYPLDRLDDERRRMIDALQRTMPPLIDRLLELRPPRLMFRALGSVLASRARRPERLRALYRHWQRCPERAPQAAPSLVFAVIGQARCDGVMTPQRESAVLDRALRFWALRTAMDTAATCGPPRRPVSRALPQPMQYPAHAVY